MLFLQGTRDDFARLDLITEVCAGLGPHARLELFDGADHSFGVKKGSGRTKAEVQEDMAATIAAWADLGPRGADE
jgi:predicted alpha/beta-hydrolase family hydrolase